MTTEDRVQGHQRVFSAERRINGVRLVVVLSGVALYPMFFDAQNSRPALAWALLVSAFLYGLWMLVYEPYRRLPMLLSAYFASVSDAFFTMLWLYATGGITSPFFVATYMAIVAVAFRFRGREAAFAAGVYGVCYLAMVVGLGQWLGHEGDIVVRITYMGLAALFGWAIARERLEAHEAKERVLEEAVKAREAFLSIASHELKTPLHALSLNFELLQLHLEERGNGDTTILARRLQRQITRLDRLVRDLLNVARVTHQGITLCPTMTSLSILLEAGLNDLQLAHGDNGRMPKVVLDIEPGIEGLWDTEYLTQLVGNLLSNAVKYGRGSPIAVSAFRQNGSAFVRVADHGIGIPKADQERVFRQFERNVSEREFGGFGVGLWIAQTVAHAHGGHISVESEAGQGATFTVRLPLATKSMPGSREPGSPR